MATSCRHLDQIRDVMPSGPGCVECVAAGKHDWVHLRWCQECGHVGCCDNSPGKHATKHYHDTQHPVMRSFQPDEDWGWCFVDEVMLEPAPKPR